MIVYILYCDMHTLPSMQQMEKPPTKKEPSLRSRILLLILALAVTPFVVPVHHSQFPSFHLSSKYPPNPDPLLPLQYLIPGPTSVDHISPRPFPPPIPHLHPLQIPNLHLHLHLPNLIFPFLLIEDRIEIASPCIDTEMTWWRWRSSSSLYWRYYLRCSG